MWAVVHLLHMEKLQWMEHEKHNIPFQIANTSSERSRHELHCEEGVRDRWKSHRPSLSEETNMQTNE